jgi:hypothetical protein
LVGVSVVVFLLPFIQQSRFWQPTPCSGPQCVLAFVVTGIGTFLPALAAPWIAAFERTPGTFAVLVALIAWLTARGAAHQACIRDAMNDLWMSSNQPVTDDPRNHWIYRLRTHRLYQRSLQLLKWKIAPAIFGISILALGVAALGAAMLIGYQRTLMFMAERSERVCQTLGSSTEEKFHTHDVCWDSGATVNRGKRQRVTLTVTEPWFDSSVPATPLGVGDQMPTVTMFAIPFRRIIIEPWFRPMAKVVSADGSSLIYPLVMSRIDATPDTYVAYFEPQVSGRVFLFVNDALAGFPGLSASWYRHNHGAATVRIAAAEREEH